jgi:hypothetical protein
MSAEHTTNPDTTSAAGQAGDLAAHPAADQLADGPADQGAGAAAPQSAQPGSVPEDTKRRFREALDRKHSHGGRDVSGSGGSSKAHDAHGPASTQRTFRRKSGG